MKVLKISAILFAGMLIANTASAQKGMYATANFGYGFSLNSQNITTNTTEELDALGNRASGKEENVTGSFGKGMSFGGTIGYMFSDNIGADLGINYLMGASYESTDKTTQSGAGYSEIRTGNMSANMLQFNPSFVLSAGKSEGLNPYAKFGIVIGAMGKITRDGESTEVAGGVTTKMVNSYEMTGGTALGWSAGVGAIYSFNEKLGLFGELNMVNMSWAPTKGELVANTVNGVDGLAHMDTKDKETEFVDEVDFLKAIPATSPDEDLKQNFSFSSIGLKVGLRFQF